MVDVRSNCFDASALVKLYIVEEGSAVVRPYFNTEPNKYTTPFCFFEALSVLKSKRFLRKDPISQDNYETATFNLAAWFAASSANLPDVKLTDPLVFAETQTLSRKHSLDLSDAFQIMSVKKGYYSPLIGGSQTILVTADEALAIAARSEGLRVWNLMKEPAPQ